MSKASILTTENDDEKYIDIQALSASVYLSPLTLSVCLSPGPELLTFEIPA